MNVIHEEGRNEKGEKTSRRGKHALHFAGEKVTQESIEDCLTGRTTTTTRKRRRKGCKCTVAVKQVSMSRPR